MRNEVLIAPEPKTPENNVPIALNKPENIASIPEPIALPQFAIPADKLSLKIK